MVAVVSRLYVVREIPLQDIFPSSFLNLRVSLVQADEFGDLVASIRRRGLLQPLVVRSKRFENEAKFEIVCGHRRYAACKKLQMTHIPCVILPLDDRAALEVALIENIQRQNLNPIEEAEAFKMYVVNFGRGSITSLATRIGKSEEYMSHRLLLLGLPKEVLEKISRRLLKPSQACELVWLKDRNQQIVLAEEITTNNLSFRQTRAAVKLIRAENLSPEEAAKRILSQEGTRFSEKYDLGESTPWLRYVDRTDRNEIDHMDALDHGVLVLRTCLAGLDMLADQTDDPELRELFLKQRGSVHDALDEIIRRKVTYSKKSMVISE